MNANLPFKKNFALFNLSLLLFSITISTGFKDEKKEKQSIKQLTKKNIIITPQDQDQENNYYYELKKIFPTTVDTLLKKTPFNDQKEIYIFSKENLLTFMKYCMYSILYFTEDVSQKNFSEIFKLKTNKLITSHDHIKNFYYSILTMFFRSFNYYKTKNLTTRTIEKIANSINNWETHSHKIFLFAANFYGTFLDMDCDTYKDAIEPDIINIFKSFQYAILFNLNEYPKEKSNNYIELITENGKNTYIELSDFLKKHFLIRENKKVRCEKIVLKETDSIFCCQ